jgi:hypothetical protein
MEAQAAGNRRARRVLYTTLAGVIVGAYVATATGGGLWALGFVMGFGLGIVAMALAFVAQRNP